jgi:hypothetical protein
MQLSRRKFLQALAAIPAVAGVVKITGDWLLPDFDEPELIDWDTEVRVGDMMNFAEGDCIRIGDELMYLTNVNVATKSLTVVRGYGPSSPQPITPSTPVELVMRARQEAIY